MIKYLEKQEDFEALTSKTCLVDFYADWCGPCKMLGMVFEENDFNIDILKINTDKFPELAVKFGVMSIPTVLLMKNGKLAKKKIGYMTADEITDFINEE